MAKIYTSNFETAQQWGTANLESLFDATFGLPDVDSTMEFAPLVADSVVETEGVPDHFIFDSLVEPTASQMCANLLSYAEHCDPSFLGSLIETISNVVSPNIEINDVVQKDECVLVQTSNKPSVDETSTALDYPFAFSTWSKRERETLEISRAQYMQTSFHPRTLTTPAPSTLALVHAHTLRGGHGGSICETLPTTAEATESLNEPMELSSSGSPLGPEFLTTDLASGPSSLSGASSSSSSPPLSASNPGPLRLYMSTSTPQEMQEEAGNLVVRRLDLSHLHIIFDALAESKILYAYLLPILKYRTPRVCHGCRKPFNAKEEETRHILSHLQSAIIPVYPSLNPSKAKPRVPQNDKWTDVERTCWIRVAEVLSAVLDRDVEKTPALVKEFSAVLKASKTPTVSVPATPIMATHNIISQYPARWLKNQACITHPTALPTARWDKFVGKEGHCYKYAAEGLVHCERNLQKAEIFPPPDTTWHPKIIVDTDDADWGSYPSLPYPIHEQDRFAIQQAAKGKDIPYLDSELKSVPQRATRAAPRKAASSGVQKKRVRRKT